uniref:Uncharacterized protein n=1 Tax=Anguilla anguilla TaxID=7936 RepID=A0A0E9R4E6_ANGAN
MKTWAECHCKNNNTSVSPNHIEH